MMIHRTAIANRLTGLGVMLMLIGALETPAVAEMSTHTQPSSSPWHPIEQPLALKVGVTVGGIALIGLELWWFLNRDRTPKSLDQ